MDLWTSLKTPLNKDILNTLIDFKFDKMTPVQTACIPLFRNCKDVAAEAITGSGKTLAFVIPMLEILLKKKEDPLRKYDVGAIIITPTRELALQIHDVVSVFLKRLPQFTLKLFVGGNNPSLDIETFTNYGAHIIVATPGRLDDLFKRNLPGLNFAACCKALEVLILDEADRLLSMGFKTSLTSILSYLPKLRRTGLFSATLTDEVEDLIRAGLRNPVRIVVKEKNKYGENSEQKTPKSLKNYYLICELDQKINYLVKFLHCHKSEKILVFFSTCACVDYFSKILTKLLKKFEILSIHGKKDNRNNIFSKFKSIKSGVLICTDVMGRGIDIPEISWVIQYDPPSSASNFVHRCGRTARIGHSGNALVFLQPSEDSYVKFIEINQQVPLETYELNVTESCIDKIKKIAQSDRAIYEKGIQAYVSFVQSYAKHECSLIFKVKDLNFGKLAEGFGLLHLPRMPETKNKSIQDFVPTNCDLNSIPYLEKSREKQRLEKLQNNENLEKKKKYKPKEKPWSKKQDQKLKKIKRKETKDLKRKYEESQDDLDELADDARLIKKLKSGKISKEEFYVSFKDS